MAEESRRLHESSTGQLLVGLFVVAATVGFVWLMMDLRQGPERYRLVAEFDALGSTISEATVVKLRGFTVGQVDGIEFRPSPASGAPYFLVRLGIERKYPIPAGTVAEIRGSGLVGEAYIHLDVSAAGTAALKPGAHLPGRSDESMKTLMTKIRDAAEKLGGAGGAIRDAELGQRLSNLTRDVSRIADDLGGAAHSADALLRAGRQVVSGIEPGVLRSLESLDRSMARLAVTMERTDTLVAATSQDLRRSVRAMRLLVERLDAVLVRVDSLVLIKQQQIDETVSNLHETSAAVRDLSQNPWRLVIGRGDGQVAEEMDLPRTREEGR